MLAYLQKPTDGEDFEQYAVSKDGKINAVKSTSNDGGKRVMNVETDRRTSSMPGAPRNKDFNESRRDISAQFNKSYNEAGIQPSSLDDRGKKNQNKNQSAQTPNQTYTQQPRPNREAPVTTRTRRRKLTKKRVAQEVVGKAKATTVNLWLWAWGGWAWFMFQLPMAIFSIIFLGLSQILWSVFNNTTPTPPDDNGNIFYQIGNAVYDAALGIMGAVGEWFLSAFGIDINVLQPANFFMLTHTIVMVIGVGTLFLCYIQYKLALINPLFGRASSLKMGMFLLAIIGYSIPILNLFPWFFAWTFVVWLYPK